MSQQTIGVGTVAGDGTGDTLRAAWVKGNSNFTELYGDVAAIASTLSGFGTVVTHNANEFPLSANNLSDLSSAMTARSNLGLGTAAVQNVGAFCQVANNLSDIVNAATARTNLGLGTAAIQATGTFAQVANNLSDLANAATARTNLGLGSAALASSTAFVSASSVGAASGVASLDGSGKVPTSQLPSSVLGANVYQGVWNASTNTPTLASSTGTKGFWYKISVAGTTTLDGVSSWSVGDQVVFDGSTWDKIDGNASEVLSVAGRTGVVTLSTTDISGLGGLATLGAAPAGTLTGTTLNNTVVTSSLTSVGTLGTLTVSGAVAGGSFAVGTIGFTDSNVLESLESSVNNYNQVVIQNANAGAAASADLVVCNNNSTASTYYGDFGINSSGYTGSGALNGPNNVFLTATSGDLVLGTTTSNGIHFVVNNGATDCITISSAGAATFANTVSFPAALVTGLTGATAASRHVGATAGGAPTTGTFAKGDTVVDQNGVLWVCIAAGSPGQWNYVGDTPVQALGNVSGTVNLDFTKSNRYSFTITGNTTLTFTAPYTPKAITVWQSQNGTGGFSLTYPAMKWPGAIPGTITQAASATDVLSMQYDGAAYWGAVSIQNGG